MLHLASASEPSWVGRALADLDAILLDHAHLEKKAAAAALNLIFRYPDRPLLMQPLSELAREELLHFEAVLAALGKRGSSFGPQRPAPYAGRLREVARVKEPERLLDSLICSALIEARSAERMGLLKDALLAAEGEPERALGRLYQGLLAAEARHHRLYLDLAESLFPKPEVDARLDQLARHEAAILADAPLEPRFHNR
jgi:tRNA-(ms[2]io[6]A)-hydroxylase